MHPPASDHGELLVAFSQAHNCIHRQVAKALADYARAATFITRLVPIRAMHREALPVGLLGAGRGTALSCRRGIMPSSAALGNVKNMYANSPVSPSLVGQSDLVRLLEVLIRRKSWVVVGAVVSMLAGAVYLTLAVPIYQASVTLRIGHVGGSALEPPEVLASRLLIEYGPRIADGISRKRPYLKRVTPQRGAPAVVELVAEGDQPEDAAGLLERVFSGIQVAHGEIYDHHRDSLNERLGGIERRSRALQKQYDDASLLLEKLKANEPVQASLIALERSRIMAIMTELEAEKPGVVQKLSPPQTQPTELLGAIAAPASPSSPRTALVLALAALLGLIGGILLAFAVELAFSVRRRSSDAPA